MTNKYENILISLNEAFWKPVTTSALYRYEISCSGAFYLTETEKKTEHRNEVLVLMCCFPWKIVTLAWKNADITKNRNEWTLTTIFCKTKYDSLVSHHISSFSFIPGKC